MSEIGNRITEYIKKNLGVADVWFDPLKQTGCRGFNLVLKEGSAPIEISKIEDLEKKLPVYVRRILKDYNENKVKKFKKDSVYWKGFGEE